jgi:hypothetical protein
MVTPFHPLGREGTFVVAVYNCIYVYIYVCVCVCVYTYSFTTVVRFCYGISPRSLFLTICVSIDFASMRFAGHT